LIGYPKDGKDNRIFLRADRTVPYGELMDKLEIPRMGCCLKVARVAVQAVPHAAIEAPRTPVTLSI